MKQFALVTIGGGKGLTITDNDLWGLTSSLSYLLAYSSYFDGQNKKWAENMVNKLDSLRSDE